MNRGQGNGKVLAHCKISLGGMFGRGISFSYNDQASDGSLNESLSVEHTDGAPYLKALGMAVGRWNGSSCRSLANAA